METQNKLFPVRFVGLAELWMCRCVCVCEREREREKEKEIQVRRWRESR